jgi:hypothetical protein
LVEEKQNNVIQSFCRTYVCEWESLFVWQLKYIKALHGLQCFILV